MFHELSKIFSRNLCIANIILLLRISNFVCVPKAMDTHTKFQFEILSINVISAQLALRRWPNVGPTSTLTLGQRRLTNVGPTWICQLAQRLHANVVPTSAQRWHTNVGPTLAQRYANGCMPTLYQHWLNGGCVTGFLWGEPIGHRSVTGWANSWVE